MTHQMPQQSGPDGGSGSRIRRRTIFDLLEYAPRAVLRRVLGLSDPLVPRIAGLTHQVIFEVRG